MSNMSILLPAKTLKKNLVQVASNSFYINDRLSVGIFRLGNKSAVLIDSGIDSSNGKKISSTLSENNELFSGTVSAIINTHSHADHCGGNQYFQTKLKDIRIYTTSFEKVFIENPYLEPFCMCGGANPPHELRNKFLEALPSRVTDTLSTDKDSNINIEGTEFKIIQLPGHTDGSTGVITPDGIFYSGDALFGQETLTKHGVLFDTNVAAALISLEKMRKLPIHGCVLYHGGFVNTLEYTALIDQHIDKINKTSHFIYSYIQQSKGITIDDLNAAVINQLNIPQTVQQSTLNRTCLTAYLTYLQERKFVKYGLSNGKLIVLDCFLKP